MIIRHNDVGMIKPTDDSRLTAVTRKPPSVQALTETPMPTILDCGVAVTKQERTAINGDDESERRVGVALFKGDVVLFAMRRCKLNSG